MSIWHVINAACGRKEVEHILYFHVATGMWEIVCVSLSMDYWSKTYNCNVLLQCCWCEKVTTEYLSKKSQIPPTIDPNSTFSCLIKAGMQFLINPPKK